MKSPWKKARLTGRSHGDAGDAGGGSAGDAGADAGQHETGTLNGNQAKVLCPKRYYSKKTTGFCSC